MVIRVRDVTVCGICLCETASVCLPSLLLGMASVPFPYYLCFVVMFV